MNILKTTITAFAALAFAGVASAQTDIFISGSNGDRTATNTALSKILTGATFSGNNTLTKANYGVFSGGTFQGQAVTVYVSYIGATGGIKAVAGFQKVKFVPAGSSGTSVPDPTVSGNPNQQVEPDFTMSTNFQATSPYQGLYQGVQYETLTDQLIGVTGLKFLGSKNFPGDNATSQALEALYLSGAQPLAIFTGDVADKNKTVYAIGRNTDAGQRYIALAEPKVGGSNVSAVNAVVKQYKPTIAGTTSVNGVNVGGHVTSHVLWPVETVSGVDSRFPGNSGFTTGANLAPALTATLDATVYQAENASATAGYYIGYLTPGDADTIAIPNGAVELKYNGVAYSADNVRQGKYTAWVYSHLLYRSSLTGLKRDLADALATQIKTIDAPAGGGILLNTVEVQRFSEGGNVTPIYF